MIETGEKAEWEKVLCRGIAPSGKIPAVLEAASPPVCRPAVFSVQAVSYLGHLAQELRLPGLDKLTHVGKASLYTAGL